MKRGNESQQNQQGSDENHKKPRYTQPNYTNAYPQYGMMPQYNQSNPFGQSAGNAYGGGYGGGGQPQAAAASIYNMGGYGGSTSMMAPQYGAGYPQAFSNSGVPYGASVQAQSGLMAGEASRTVYLGNINTKEITAHDILKCVRTGMIESLRVCSDKSCAFVGFLDPAAAQAFFQEYLTKKLIIKGAEIKFGWGKSNTITNQLKLQIQGGATRTVYLGRLAATDTEETLKATLGKYGPIEHIKLIRDKGIAFVHFLSISCAVKCVSVLVSDSAWKDKKINYGKDHCVAQNDFNIFGFGQPQQNIQQGFGGLVPYGMQQQQQQQQYHHQQQEQSGNVIAPSGNVLRTLYVGNLHPDAKAEDICNVIRGGNLLQIRYFPEKNIAFVTFMDAATALSVFNHTQANGLIVKGRKLRIGWGKPCSISGPVSQAIQQGATRNIYIGCVPETLTVEKIRNDFKQYGDIELVNTFKEKKCAFVNFTNVGNAVTAITAMKLNPDYADFKLSFGKDRCGNAFKPIVPKKSVLKAAADNDAADAAAPANPAAADPAAQADPAAADPAAADPAVADPAVAVIPVAEADVVKA